MYFLMSIKEVYNRRSVLKRSLAAGATIAGVSGTALGSNLDDLEQMQRDILEAERIEWGYGEREKARFLDERGYKHANRTIEFELDVGGEEDEEETVDIESIDDPQDGGIKATIGGYYNTHSAYYSASLTTNYWLRAVCAFSNVGYYSPDSGGSQPKDAAAIRWNPPWAEYWELIDGGGENAVFGSEHVSWDENRHNPGTGRTGFRFDDLGITNDWVDDLPDCGWWDAHVEEEYERAGTCGVMLTPAGDHEMSERKVWGSYTHAWSNIRISVSPQWDSGGFDLTLSPYVDVDDAIIKTDEDGNDLEITQAEIRDNKFP